MIAASYYWGGSSSAGPIYTHPDHAIVSNTIRTNSFSGVTWRWGATAYGDTRTGRTDAIPGSYHSNMFKAAPSPTSLGAFQKAYGWLLGAHPDGDPDGYWDYGTFVKQLNGNLYQRHWQYAN